jgi:hypothetical protein
MPSNYPSKRDRIVDILEVIINVRKDQSIDVDGVRIVEINDEGPRVK